MKHKCPHCPTSSAPLNHTLLFLTIFNSFEPFFFFFSKICYSFLKSSTIFHNFFLEKLFPSDFHHPLCCTRFPHTISETFFLHRPILHLLFVFHPFSPTPFYNHGNPFSLLPPTPPLHFAPFSTLTRLPSHPQIPSTRPVVLFTPPVPTFLTPIPPSILQFQPKISTPDSKFKDQFSTQFGSPKSEILTDNFWEGDENEREEGRGGQTEKRKLALFCSVPPKPPKILPFSPPAPIFTFFFFGRGHG